MPRISAAQNTRQPRARRARQPDVFIDVGQHPELWPLLQALNYATPIDQDADVACRSWEHRSPNLDRLTREGVAAVEAGDMLRAAQITLVLASKIGPADPAAWERATGRKVPQNREELRALWIEAGYPPADFEGRTPRDVFDILQVRLRVKAEATPSLKWSAESKTMTWMCQCFKVREKTIRRWSKPDHKGPIFTRQFPSRGQWQYARADE